MTLQIQFANSVGKVFKNVPFRDKNWQGEKEGHLPFKTFTAERGAQKPAPRFATKNMKIIQVKALIAYQEPPLSYPVDEGTANVLDLPSGIPQATRCRAFVQGLRTFYLLDLT